jgi:hypothetical protein
MKLKVVIVDLEIPPKVKRWGLRLGIPAVVLTIAAVALAGPLHAWNQGDTLDATDLNGNFSNLQGQITTATFGTRPPSAFHASLQTATSLPSGTSTVIAFDSVEFDLAGEYDKTTGTFTATNKGVYSLHCGVEFRTPTTNSNWAAVMFKSGTQLAASDIDVQAGTSGLSTAVDGLYQLNAGDSITCAGFQNSGASQPLYLSYSTDWRNNFSAARIY